MIVILDRQHYGKPGKSDPGAVFDLDKNGKVETQEQEANLTPRYIMPMVSRLKQMRITTHVLDKGWYPDRHKVAVQIARDNPKHKVAYLACHLNAGGGTYAAVIHDARSKGGALLAAALATGLEDAHLFGVKTQKIAAASPDNAWKNVYHTISGIYAGPANISGVCVEPYFLDQPAHEWLTTPEGGEAVAMALIDGVVRWSMGG